MPVDHIVTVKLKVQLLKEELLKNPAFGLISCVFTTLNVSSTFWGIGGGMFTLAKTGIGNRAVFSFWTRGVGEREADAILESVLLKDFFWFEDMDLL